MDPGALAVEQGEGRVPAMLLVAIALEAATYLLVARAVLGLAWPGAAAFAVGGLLALRAAIVTLTWVLAARHPEGRPPLPTETRVRMWIGEYLAFIALFLVLMPFERLWMRADRLRPCRRPVLLVHGYACSRGIWGWMRRRLESAGHVVATASLAPPYTSIDALMPQLAQRIAEVRAATGAEKVVLVAHSMGGLVSRAYLAAHGGASVERLVTLATPHQGSELARLGFGRNARQMEPDSAWLRALPALPDGTPGTSIRNAHDNYVTPPFRQRLPGAEDIPLEGVGHLAVLFSPRALAAVARTIGDAR